MTARDESSVDEVGRPIPPSDAGEASTLIGFLEYQRATFRWKSGNLDDAALDISVGASSLTLGGMLKHLAIVEDWWFSQWVAGNPPSEDWEDDEADPDWDFRTARNETGVQLRARWESLVDQSRRVLADALRNGDLGQLCKREEDGRSPNLRWVVVHMIEEYARHNGHADLIRESIDGEVGE
ncbi:MAG: DinB family protein [Acidimicrobiales bacterium]